MDPRPNVLVFDDEPGVRESLRAILARECAVYVAHTGEAALALLASTPIDVITLDLRMPGMDGLALLERLRARDRDIEAVIISGCPADASLAQGAAVEVFGCVSKPFDVDHVRSLVQAAALRRQAVRQLCDTKQRLVAAIGEALAASAQSIVRGAAAGEATEVAGGTTPEEQQRAIAEICADDGRLLRYLEGLFFLSDLRTGKTCIQSETVDLAGLLGETAVAHRARAVAKGVRVLVQERLRLAVRTDRQLLHRLLDLLLDNAVTFTKAGEVRVTAAVAGAGVAIVIRSAGVGLPADQAALSSGRGPDGAAGLSLGLPTATAIVRALHGDLDIRTPAGAGTEVRITLPIGEPVAAAVAAEREARCAR